MFAAVCWVRGDGARFEVGPGAIIGRLTHADIPIPDPRVSEAHALLSLRAEAFHLLGLRGRFMVNGEVSTDTALEEGMRIELAPGAGLTVDAIQLPAAILALATPGQSPIPLPGVVSVAGQPAPTIRSGFHADASDHIFPDGEEAVRISRGQLPQMIQVGNTFQVDGVPFTLQTIPLRSLSTPRTRAEGRYDAPLRIITRYDVVHIQREGAETLILSGVGATLISEIAAQGGTADWETLARIVWPNSSVSKLRHRLDVNLSRLRKRLSDARIRRDLLSMNGCGQAELLLHHDDTLVDEG